MNSAARIGLSSPLGATNIEGGANFSLFSRGATGVELLFFDNESDARPSRVIPLDPAANRTYQYWHVFVRGVEPVGRHRGAKIGRIISERNREQG